jgi:enamine deaminase RidA (YjgF/YER057c/UK114 family)
MNKPDCILREEGFSLEFRTNKVSVSPDRFLAEIDEILGGNGYVLQERIIIPPRILDQADNFSARNIAPARCNRPLIFVGHDGLGVQYSSLIARPEKLKSKVENNDEGIKITADGINFLYSAPVTCSYGGEIRSFAGAFRKIGKILRSFRMRPSSLVRTWLFLGNILQDYEGLNAARKQSFERWRFTANNFLPASTGIHERFAVNDKAAFAFCAFSGNKITAEGVLSPLQNEPTTYGVLFSRALCVGFSRSGLLFISGTAAIDKNGVSAHAGNFRRQLEFTLKIITAILKRKNAGFPHIAQAVVYLKRHKDMDLCFSILDKAGFPRNRTLFQAGVDICRDDLLCEIEVTAVIPRKRQLSR